MKRRNLQMTLKKPLLKAINLQELEIFFKLFKSLFSKGKKMEIKITLS